MRERCELPQWGLGRSPSRNRIRCILAWVAVGLAVFHTTGKMRLPAADFVCISRFWGLVGAAPAPRWGTSIPQTSAPTPRVQKIGYATDFNPLFS